MREVILKELDRIERDENVKILIAVESGSRAWGFASDNSDYDVRFIYTRDKNFYLRLDKTRDVIEYPIDDLLDVNGWDIDKALKLLYASNPALFEWIMSPIVYKTTPEIEKLKKISNRYFSKSKMINHHYHIALSSYKLGIVSDDEIKLKKYFYTLRSISAAKYVLENNEIPPIEFDKLREIGIPKRYNQIVDELLEIKLNSPEKKIIKRNNELDKYIEDEFKKLDDITHNMDKEEEKDWTLLNDYFRNVIE